MARRDVNESRGMRMAVWTADAGKPTAGIAAVDVALNDFFDDGAEERTSVESRLVFLAHALIFFTKKYLCG